MIQNKYYKLGDMNKRICLIADIHFSENYNLETFSYILANVKENRPDFICIPGDLLDDNNVSNINKIDNLINFIKQLSDIGSVIISLGNHDITNFVGHKRTYLFNEKWYLNLNTIQNVYFLNNKSLIRDNITFIGLSNSFSYYYSKPNEDVNKFIDELDNFIKVRPNTYNILLCHSPVCPLKKDTIQKSKNIKKIDLILSGHMHNGLTFKFLDKKGTRGIIGPFNKILPKYARGYTFKYINNRKVNLIINGSVIKFSNEAPKIFHKLNFLYPINIDYIDI